MDKDVLSKLSRGSLRVRKKKKKKGKEKREKGGGGEGEGGGRTCCKELTESEAKLKDSDLDSESILESSNLKTSAEPFSST